MNQLWSGLMGNSELPWRAGAAVLAERSLFAEDLLPQKTPVPPVEELAATLQRIAVRAQAATDTGVRGEIFGELLATCAGCHELTDHDVRNGSLRFE